MYFFLQFEEDREKIHLKCEKTSSQLTRERGENIERESLIKMVKER
jgi:hypothetical protein